MCFTLLEQRLANKIQLWKWFSNCKIKDFILQTETEKPRVTSFNVSWYFFDHNCPHASLCTMVYNNLRNIYSNLNQISTNNQSFCSNVWTILQWPCAYMQQWLHVICFNITVMFAVFAVKAIFCTMSRNMCLVLSVFVWWRCQYVNIVAIFSLYTLIG